MSEASKTSSQTTCKVSCKSISLQELVDGATHCGLPDGPTIEPSGPGHALASHLVPQERDKEKAMNATYGWNFLTLLKHPDRLSLWESKLRGRLAMGGSMACKMTWREKVTPQGRLIYRLAPSMPRTSGSVSFGFLPTPCASEERDIARPDVLAKCDRGGRVARRICSLSLQARTQKEPVSLNPSFAGWMMGYSKEWDACAPTEMPSSRKSRLKS